MSFSTDMSGLNLDFLGIAEGRVYNQPVKVQTLLGSCVAVTLHCRACGAGGIFHGLLPRRADFTSDGQDMSPYRFVDTGVEVLSAAMSREGADLNGLEAKVFGGAGTLAQEKIGVGLKNVRAALDTLSRLGIRVSAVNVGGRIGRKLLFLPHSGEVYVKKLPVQHGGLPPECRLDAS